MPAYEYRGVDKRGKNVKGTLEADSERQLRQLLKQRGILLTKVGKGSEGQGLLSKEIDFEALFEKITPQDIALFTRQLATLIKARIPLSDALAACVEQVEKPKLKKIVSKLRTDVNEGLSFAGSLEQFDDVFGGLYSNMVRSGEASGKLDEVLMRLSEFTESSVKLRQKISSALMYPMIMVVVGSLILIGLFVGVIPQITKIFEDSGQELPGITTVIIAISHALQDYWYIFLITFFVLSFAFKRYIKTPTGHERWDRMKLKFPVFGNLFLLVGVARFTKTLSTLLASGVPLLTALDITKNVLGNLILESVVQEACVAVKEGAPLAVPLKQSQQFPTMVVHMISIGERSGALEEMLDVVADNYESQVEAQVSRLTTLLEPIMILGMGFVIVIILFAVLMPILQMNDFVQ
jgi:general secretion pathway protein F